MPPKSMQELYRSSKILRKDAVAHARYHDIRTGGEACDSVLGVNESQYSQEELEKYAKECTLPDNAPATSEESTRQHAHATEMRKIRAIFERLRKLDPASFEPRDYEKKPDNG